MAEAENFMLAVMLGESSDSDGELVDDDGKVMMQS